MICYSETKPEDAVILYDIDKKKLTTSIKYETSFEQLKPMIVELESYLSLNCNVGDFDTLTKRLKFKDNHSEKIFSIFKKYETTINNGCLKYLFIYGYWFSNIGSRYFNTYFDVNINTKAAKGNVYVFRECSICKDIYYDEVNTKADLDDFINQNYKYGIGGNEFKCNKCDDKFRQERMKKDQDNKDKMVSNLKTMPYKDYLETDHWKSIRRKKLRLSGNKCQICGSKVDLNVHHNTYENRGCENDEDLVVLCNKCHKKFHDIKDDVIENNNQTSIDKDIKTKLFVLNLLDDNNDIINDFILSETNEFIDIKTNVFENTYTALLIYK